MILDFLPVLAVEFVDRGDGFAYGLSRSAPLRTSSPGFPNPCNVDIQREIFGDVVPAQLSSLLWFFAPLLILLPRQPSWIVFSGRSLGPLW